MNSEKCIFCGSDIPEGRQVCPICESDMNRDREPKKQKSFCVLRLIHNIFKVVRNA